MTRRTLRSGAGALAAETGRIRGHPYVRVGPEPRLDGHPPLVLVPGVNDALLGVGDGWPFARAMAAYCGRYVPVGGGGVGGGRGSGPAAGETGGPRSAVGPGRERSDRVAATGDERSAEASRSGGSLVGLRSGGGRRPVLMVSRPHGIEEGVTTRKLAADYARVIGALPGGPADVVGLSMGGFVVTHLAADHPRRVRRAVSLLAADRLDDGGRRRIDGWIGQAAAGNLGAIYRDACNLLATGPRRWAMRAGAAAYARLLDPPDGAREDFMVSARACLDHDAGDRLADVAAPTLVVGGDRDPFFSLRGFRRTARGIPRGEFVFLPGAGHEAVIERGRAVEGSIRRFLRGDLDLEDRG